MEVTVEAIQCTKDFLSSIQWLSGLNGFIVIDHPIGLNNRNSGPGIHLTSLISSLGSAPLDSISVILANVGTWRQS